jgi:1-acyl-sn-glycerol-3-phosphate acyltransferase
LERHIALPPARIVLTGAGRSMRLTARLAKWGRRAASISVFAILGAVLALALPITLPAAALIDLVGRRRWATVRGLALLLVFYGLEIAGVVAAGWLWLTHVGRSDDRFVAANHRLQRWWTKSLLGAAFRLFALTLDVEGAEAAAGGPLIAMFRHVSVADTLLPMMLITEPHGVLLRWVLKIELLWDPCLDIVGNRLRNCFVSRMPETTARDVAAVGTLMDGLEPNEGVVIYPEGTRFTPAKRERLVAKLGETAARFTHVLPPRLGGALALLANNHVQADVVFCAHTGFEAITSLGDLFNGRLIGNAIRVKLWRVPFEEIPTAPEERIAWLNEQWAAIDRHVSEATGPSDEEGARASTSS